MADGGPGKKSFSLCAIEARMHTGNVVERLRNFDPAWQDGDIGNEADIAHKLIALGPRIASKHAQFSLIRSEAENCVERGGFAGAVGTDETQDTPLFHSKINAIQRHGCAKIFAQATCVYTCHSFSAPPFWIWVDSIRRVAMARRPGVRYQKTSGLRRRRSRALPR